MKNTIKYYFREARLDDIEKVYQLSNSPEVRMQSINPESITWSDHILWYKEALESKNVHFLLVHDECDNFIGQIRFDLKQDSAVINISICKEFRGRGLAAPLIIESVKKIFSEKKQIFRVIAYIKTDNPSSIQSFLRAGFCSSGEKIMRNTKHKRYILENVHAV